jgi:hypothetical protein
MTKRRVASALAVACVGLSICFLAQEVEAQRRGGGGRGGGGGRSISRSGPAAGGSFGSQRPSSSSRSSWGGQKPSAGTRPSTQPSPSTRPTTPSSTRPTTPSSARPTTPSGTRPSTRPGETRPGDAANREDWQQHRQDMQDDRQDYANHARNDWQDFYEEGGGYYYGGYYGGYYGHTVVVVDYDEHDDDWEAALAGFALGTALSSASFNSMQAGTQCSLSEVTVNEVKYYKCGSTWYNRVIDGTNVNYIIVSAPPGY